jgi:shikimate dehydrogenase
VNTLARGLPGDTADTLLGDNTDGTGLVRDLTINLQCTLRGASVLLLGAGGAARGVIAPLLESGVALLAIQNRHRERAQQLAGEFAELGPVRSARDPEDGSAPYDLIINATSASLRGEVPSISARVVGAHTLCYDCAYGERDTVFVDWARRAGAGRATMGWGMLVEQAAESFLLWRGVRPDTAPVLAAFARCSSP